ncbi:RAMP superfamily CRISPR-associated protein, partial [Streptomyces alkaliphilus]|uniref:RAMP superfamily CRISPR-associated protein n=1 Tax=Streptomyces alkaliphilus TaxID=1472722 RepID=UPI00118F2D09
MTRPTVMLFAEVELELTGYAAIGAPESDEGRRGGVRPIARTGWGAEGDRDPWAPPTSLAGSFRAHLTDDLGGEGVGALMGEAFGVSAPAGTPGAGAPTDTAGSDADDDTGDDAGGRPSKVFFLGTELRLPEDKGIVVRGQTAIDPHRAAAKETMLRRREYLPPGTRLLCRVRVDGEEHHERILDALTTWQPIIGGSRSTGHGGTRTLTVRHTTIDLNTPDGRRRWLLQGGPALFAGGEIRSPRPKRAEPAILFGWEIEEALHIGGTDPSLPVMATAPEPAPGAEGRSSKPARLLRDEEDRPYIPGSTWKGILRGRCAYILRSLGLFDCEEESHCGSCDLCAAFGWVG